MECLECIEPRSNTYQCKVSGVYNPICEKCIVHSIIKDKDNKIREASAKASEYKVKADKFDCFCRIYAEEISKKNCH